MKKYKHYIGIFLVVLAVCFIYMATKKDAKHPCSQPTGTIFKITNSTQDSVLVYLTLGGGADTTFLANVNGVFGITQSGLVGSFYLQPNDTLSYTPTLKLSGNIGFGTQGINCPDSTWKTGVNIFEFNLNEPQESLDISAMGGVNSIMNVKLIGGPAWATTNYPDVRSIQNDTMYANTNKVGVYPFKCTDCTDTLGSANCTQKAEKPSSAAICNPTRALDQVGGVVLLTFKGYTNWQICK
jgi:hypothetical protein